MIEAFHLTVLHGEDMGCACEILPLEMLFVPEPFVRAVVALYMYAWMQQPWSRTNYGL
jgi:hypothetical protein